MGFGGSKTKPAANGDAKKPEEKQPEVKHDDTQEHADSFEECAKEAKTAAAKSAKPKNKSKASKGAIDGRQSRLSNVQWGVKKRASSRQSKPGDSGSGDGWKIIEEDQIEQSIRDDITFAGDDLDDDTSLVIKYPLPPMVFDVTRSGRPRLLHHSQVSRKVTAY